MPELMRTLGLLLSFYPTSNTAPLSCSHTDVGVFPSEPVEVNCTFSHRQSLSAGPATEKSTAGSLSVGACTTQMKLHGSKYRASRPLRPRLASLFQGAFGEFDYLVNIQRFTCKTVQTGYNAVSGMYAGKRGAQC